MVIDENKIFKNFLKVKLESNEKGLIPAYTTLAIKFPTNFFNIYSLNILKAVGEDLYDYAAGLLENAAAECGYATGCGLINSPEFEATMNSMVKTPEDILIGMFAITKTWGWGDVEVTELIPGEKMVLRIYDYYEANVSEIQRPKKLFAYMWKGVARSFMDIVYGIKCTETSYTRFGTFQCEQTKGIEWGDEYGEFFVIPKSDN